MQFEAIRRAYFKKGRLNKVYVYAAEKKRAERQRQKEKAKRLEREERQRKLSADTVNSDVEGGAGSRESESERKSSERDRHNATTTTTTTTGNDGNDGNDSNDGNSNGNNDESRDPPATSIEDVDPGADSSDDDEDLGADLLEQGEESIFGYESDEFVQSLFQSTRWYTQGGKSGASFSRSLDGRFVCKVISKIELEMFINFAPYYFEYMANAFYRDLPTVLCKILGVYTLDHVREGRKKVTQNVVVMEDIFYRRNITKVSMLSSHPSS